MGFPGEFYSKNITPANLELVRRGNNALKNLNEWEGIYCLEVWKYDPLSLAELVDKQVVDPLSLYLSMKHLDDARIEMALEKIIEQYLW